MIPAGPKYAKSNDFFPPPDGAPSSEVDELSQISNIIQYILYTTGNSHFSNIFGMTTLSNI